MQLKVTSMALFLLMLMNSCMMMHHMPMDNMRANQPETTLTDPVCGLEVNPESALTLEYEGRTYYFDSG